jgi:hypothetical protein
MTTAADGSASLVTHQVSRRHDVSTRGSSGDHATDDQDHPRLWGWKVSDVAQ